MASFFGNVLNAARHVLTGDIMQSAGKFDVIEIPATQLRTNDTYVRCLDEKLTAGSADLAHLMKNVKNGLFHVVIRFQFGPNLKTWSIYRDMDANAAVNEAELFRKHGQLLLLAQTEETLASLIKCIHSHPGWDPIHVAAAVGLKPYFASLSRGNETVGLINSPSQLNGIAPLHIAVENNQVDVVRLLLTMGADITKKDSNGQNAFHYASAVNGALIQALAEHRSAASAINVPNNAGRTALFIAAVHGKPDIISALIKAGAIGTIRCENKTALEAVMSSTSERKADCVQALVKAFPTLAAEQKADGSTLLHDCSDQKILRSLVQAVGHTNTAIFDVRDANGDTPLHSAVRRADLAGVVMLISHGANVDSRNPDGQTVLHLSLSLVEKNGQLMILKALLILGASYSISNSDGCLPRHIASALAISLRKEVVQIFETIDADRCPLSQKNCVDSCRYLPSTQSSPGTTKCDAFLQIRQRLCVERLKEKKESGKKRLLNLLALDGGGIRGLVLIQVLLAFEKQNEDETILSVIDWMGATSTGAIVAATHCQGRNLRDIQRLYFRLKDVVFDTSATTMRPYDTAILERFLKEELNPNATMSDFIKPKLIVTTVRADTSPVKLCLIRNYRLPLSSKENEALGYEDPKTWPLWKAVRCSSAAPTYFSSVDSRFVDGGLVANNPTLDLLTEVANFEFAAVTAQGHDHKESAEIGCVISIGCGEMPEQAVRGSLDIAMPTGLGVLKVAGSAIAAKNLGNILLNQVTETGGRQVDRARAWCHSMGVPFFRFSPILFKDIALDTTDDATLIQMLWCTVEYLHQNHHDLELAVELLS